jgi:hypothetical protein
MKVISSLTKDKEYLRTISSMYIGTNDNQLGEEANGVLISEYQDQSAIDWRLEELKARSFTFVRHEGVHSMGAREMELDMKEFSADDIRICPLTIEQGRYTRNILLKYLGETFPEYTEFVLVDILQQACDMKIDYIESLIEIIKWKTE